MNRFKVGQIVYGVKNFDAFGGWVTEMDEYIDKPMTIYHMEDGEIRVRENRWVWCEKTLRTKPEPKYKRGDKVVCVDDTYTTNKLISKGKVYTVVHSHINNWDEELLELEEGQIVHNYKASRFELLPEPKYKVGDMVSIKKNEDCHFGWVTEMDETIGFETRIIKSTFYNDLDRAYEYRVQGEIWSYCENCFEKIKEEPHIFCKGDILEIEGYGVRRVIKTNGGYNLLREEEQDVAYFEEFTSLEDLTVSIKRTYNTSTIKVTTKGGRRLWLSK